MSRLEGLPAELESASSSIAAMLNTISEMITSAVNEHQAPPQHEVAALPSLDNAMIKLDMVFRESRNWEIQPETPADLICPDFNTWKVAALYRKNVERMLGDLLEAAEKTGKKRRFRR